jgi:protein-ribulosamine 3-kinase
MFFCKRKRTFLMKEQNILEPVSELLRKHLGNNLEVISVDEKGGGSINSAAVFRTNEGNFFAKWNTIHGRQGMFQAEMKGLQILESANEIRIPKPIGFIENDTHCYLVMEHMEPTDFDFDFWEVFGSKLARLHKHSSEKFGLDHDNFVGSLPQINAQKDSWSEFFTVNRIQPQLKMAVDSGKADAQLVKKFENLYTKLDEIFPTEKPALLHGDSCSILRTSRDGFSHESLVWRF